jgi:hypothetical protein
LSGTLYPTDSLALGNIFELQLTSPNSRPAGLGPQETDFYDHADLSHVGVIVRNWTAAGAGPPTPAILFALATHAPWSSPNEVEFSVLIDVDEDGDVDYRVFNGNTANYQGQAGANDVFVGVWENLHSGLRHVTGPLNAVQPEAFDSAPFFSRVMVLPVSLAELGDADLTDGFDYWVETTSIDLYGRTENRVDRTRVLHYVPQQPALSFLAGNTGTAAFADSPGAAIQVRLDVARYAGQLAPTIMLVHHHNPPPTQVETIRLQYQWSDTLHLPLISR